ncbi:L,D-transpeptidase family protein [Alicyclobacillus sp. SO9]|uniref:L,D-transpeptidase family protein n=1 Tax=Alicyclobacillus sp. SO9 TaxID=2665646 RepID=UPI0018E7516D|nr:L,D-transpeptidase family protein [Alicyclobacillus sp. SO9]QQE79937.1 murein L,D-transpeptidase [Alicyclobacillus sp. SO9]
MRKQPSVSVTISTQKSPQDTASSNTPHKQPPPVSYPSLQTGSKGSAVLRLQQLLASLGYMPVTWSPKHKQKLTSKLELTDFKSPPQGVWKWRSHSVQTHLSHFFNKEAYSVITQGAVMSFEADHNLKTDGIAGPEVWKTLISASLKHEQAHYRYAYVYVTKHRPERLTLWYNGKVVETSLANTGISQSPTQDGTWPVYLRYRSQTMQGTNPNGSHYKDKGVPYVNYFHGGDAVHGFIRSSYGFPQSLGCVELPISKAKISWNYIHYGTLVTVAG